MAQEPNGKAAPEKAPAPPMPADMRTVLIGLESKLKTEREMIIKALNDPKLIRDFNTFNQLVLAMQGSIRAIDTLVGRTDILGNPIEKPTVNVEPEFKGGKNGGTKRLKEAKGTRVNIKKPDLQ